ncbi:xenotropic and polytropic retrovirus receptor 1 [Podospora conica]|nr:xenotropic and polytropic retrovirus receptor 1 [Schizothecium conicum]
MKYGEQFERESAPQWSLHNIDYNSLKHHIKVHTTRDQATSIPIPGHQDASLRRFEDDLYAELTRQHDRVDLFVSSKSDEIARRLRHLSNQIHRLLVGRAPSPSDHRASLKRQRRFARYEQSLLQCGDDIQSLQRFVDAQIVAFRKICKKYRKWTGSSTLGTRFRDNVLAHPKSFTRRDYSHLQSEYDELKTTLHGAFPTSPSGAESPSTDSVRTLRASEQPSPNGTVVAAAAQHPGYWNEYDHGSEADDTERRDDNTYAIYINPNEDTSFPGVASLAALFSRPLRGLKKFRLIPAHASEASERGPLLSSPPSTYGAIHRATSSGGSLSDTEAEDDSSHPTAFRPRGGSFGYASSLEEFPVGYKTYAALPSLEDQHLARYRERVLSWGTWSAFGVAYLLMGIAAVLIKTGRHKMRLEVDAGVTLGIMASLGAACAGLGMSMSRQDRVWWVARMGVWVGFVAACVLNGVLLVMVVGNPPG